MPELNRTGLLTLAFLLSNCAGGGDAPAMSDAGDPTDAAADSAIDAGATGGCSPLGLYMGTSCTEMFADAIPFRPSFELWSDGAAKERFLRLPEGAPIHSDDSDAWVFPVGTRIYKTFSVGGVKIETRVLEKVLDAVGPDAWQMRVFAWSASQDSVAEVVNGVDNALGTDHDIPETSLCVTCHRGANDVSLGLSAIQLSNGSTGLVLGAATTDALFTRPIDPATAQVPGDALTRPALGYLHANCSHCHGGAGAPHGLTFRLRTALATPEDTDTYMTAVGQPAHVQIDMAETRIKPGQPEDSTVYLRMHRRGTDQMPPVATEQIDETGAATLHTWISNL